MLAAAFPQLGIGFLGVAFAFGLTVLTMAYAVGHISGGHFNPAVTLGLWAAGRCDNKHVIPYIAIQLIGAVLASAMLWLIASGKPDWVPNGFAANGYGALSPGKYSMGSCFLAEFLLTFFFLTIIIGTTSKGAATGFAGGDYIGQLWLFWLAPIAGAMIAGVTGRILYEPSSMIETVIVDKERVV